MLTDRSQQKVRFLYGSEQAGSVCDRIAELVNRYSEVITDGNAVFLNEKDILLITYADSLHQPGFAPLKSLSQFAEHRLGDLVSIIHLLPFFPYSSDDGFSVIDYREVNPACGSWDHIEHLRKRFDLCFDLVLNHVSAGSHYFRGYLAGEAKYREFFIELLPDTDTTGVVRPRALPLLSRYQTNDGDKWCWTTFSADQVDFNFRNPGVLIEMLDILLTYVMYGARVIRLDAIAYLWKELGTSCVHLPQTHTIVQLMRDVLDMAAPNTILLTETNFPHDENISYFGNGFHEAQMVYNFPLPPLTLHAIHTGQGRYLTEWARTVMPVSERTTFLNFTASHDGIGVRPAATILPPEEFERLIKLATEHGGQVSCKFDEAGEPIPYELNINYFDAINNPRAQSGEDIEIDRFLLSQSIPLVFRGMPGIYIHSLLGSRNWYEGVHETGQPRAINREKLNLDILEQQLLDEGSRRSQVFRRYGDLIRIRRGQKAFHPNAGQEIIDLGDAFFVVVRIARNQSEIIWAIHHLRNDSTPVTLDPALMEKYDFPRPRERMTDLVTGESFACDGQGAVQITLKPYQFRWLKADSQRD